MPRIPANGRGDRELSELAKIARRSAARASKPPKVRTRDADTEHPMQVAVFDWIKANRAEDPRLDLAYAVPNFAGHHGSRGARVASGARAKAEGRRKGVPDICLPVESQRRHMGGRPLYLGLYIEMKPAGKYPKPAQRWWLGSLASAGHAVFLCRTAQEAIDVIRWHLGFTGNPGDADQYLRVEDRDRDYDPWG